MRIRFSWASSAWEKQPERSHSPEKGLKNSPVRYTRSTGYRLHWDATGQWISPAGISTWSPGFRSASRPSPGNLPFRSERSAVCGNHDNAVGIFPTGQVFKIKQPERTVEITAFLINIWHGSLLCDMLYKLVIVSIQHYFEYIQQKKFIWKISAIIKVSRGEKRKGVKDMASQTDYFS